MALLRTACTRDCPDACGVFVETDEAGRPVRLKGDPNHPITRGFLCYRIGSRHLGRLRSRDRLTRPLVRRGDRLEPTSWESALEAAAEGLDAVRRRHGAAALLHLQGGGSLGLLKQLNVRFSRLLGATETRGDVCDAAGSTAVELDFGEADANDPEEILRARHVVLWGKNPAQTSPHTAALLRRAVDGGARMVRIDPIPRPLENLAERVIRPRPGGDAALALGAARALLDREPRRAAELGRLAENPEPYLALLRSADVPTWAERAGVAPADVADLARRFAEGPVTTLIGWGLQRRSNGGEQVRAIDALHVFAGQIGRPGAGPVFTTPRKRPFDLSAVAEFAGRVPRTIPIHDLGGAIERASDPPIRGAFVDNMNPVCSNAESRRVARALSGLEFLLVLDPYLTDTARLAHVVLPVADLFEEDDLLGSYGHHRVTRARRAFAPPEGVRTDLEIYQALADRLGFGEAMAGTAEDWMRRLARPLLEAGLDWDRLADEAPLDPKASPVAFEGGRFATPSGKARLLEAWTPPEPPDADDPDRFPLSLFSTSTGRWQTSQLTSEEEEAEGPLEARVHPESAAGIADGARGRLESPLGALEVVVRHDPGMRRQCVLAPRARSLERGLCVNALVRARETDLGGGLAYLDQRVRLVPAEERGRTPRGS